MLFFIEEEKDALRELFGHSNTSHVILYPDTGMVYARLQNEFKYISCYSLSKFLESSEVADLHSNTSHVILYLAQGISYILGILLFKYISCYSLSFTKRGKRRFVDIQIHLMLFFISTPTDILEVSMLIQIHLMLFFIGAYGDLEICRA